MKGYLHKLIDSAPAAALAILASIESLGLAIGFLMLVDLVTGVWAAVRERQPITSERLRRSVVKSVVYLLALIVAAVAERFIFGPSVPILKVVSGVVASTELLSILENLSRIGGVDLMTRVRRSFFPERAGKGDDE